MDNVFCFMFISKLMDCEYCPFFLSGIYQTLSDHSQGQFCNQHRDHVNPLDLSFVLHIEKTKDTYWIFVFPEKFKMDMSLLWTERKTVFNHDRKPIYFCTREINKTQFASMLFLLHLNYLIINEISWLLSSLASCSPSFLNSNLSFRIPSHGCSIL